MDFLTWKFLHVATMFFAVALAISGELVLRRVAGSRDARAIAIVAERIRPLGNISTVLFLAGVAFGVLATLAGQIDPFRPWLLSAYAAFILAMAIGITIADPWVSRLAAAAAASPADAPSAELVAVIEDRRAQLASIALAGLIVVLVFIMVVKPFG